MNIHPGSAKFRSTYLLQKIQPCFQCPWLKAILQAEELFLNAAQGLLSEELLRGKGVAF